MVEIVMRVEGMHCGMCEAHVSDAVRKAVPSARKVKSSSRAGKTVFLGEAGNGEAARRAVEALGYRVFAVREEVCEKRGFLSKLFKK